MLVRAPPGYGVVESALLCTCQLNILGLLTTEELLLTPLLATQYSRLPLHLGIHLNSDTFANLLSIGKDGNLRQHDEGMRLHA